MKVKGRAGYAHSVLLDDRREGRSAGQSANEVRAARSPVSSAVYVLPRESLQ
jgi:hypothetical protein